jgi:hypothetical protein
VEERKDGGLDRRDFLRKAAIGGAAAVWAAPVINTIAATPAFAQTQGSREVQNCYRGGCVSACMDCDGCSTPCRSEQCDGAGSPCATYCSGPGGVCCNSQLCDPSKFHCRLKNPAVFTGSLVGC